MTTILTREEKMRHQSRRGDCGRALLLLGGEHARIARRPILGIIMGQSRHQGAVQERPSGSTDPNIRGEDWRTANQGKENSANEREGIDRQLSPILGEPLSARNGLTRKLRMRKSMKCEVLGTSTLLLPRVCSGYAQIHPESC